MKVPLKFVNFFLIKEACFIIFVTKEACELSKNPGTDPLYQDFSKKKAKTWYTCTRFCTSILEKNL
jgi:hypothetical protein